MEKVLWVLVFGALAVVTVVSAQAVVSCNDGKDRNCEDLRIVSQDNREISDALSGYRGAKFIDLHGNLMESFDTRNMPNVNQWKRLNLSYNHLSDLDFGRSQVQDIDLTYNRLESVSLPASVVSFRAERNELWTVTFLGTSVKTLVLSKNRVDTMKDIKDISKLTQLQHLDISCNRLSEVNFNDFARMNQLTNLNLARNRIYTTSGNAVLSSLRNLDLSYNILTALDESFKSVPNLEDLQIQYNRIVMVLDQAKLNFRNLRSLDARGNDWHCPSIKTLYTLTSARSSGDAECETGYRKESNLCCIETSAPFADRLIRYRKQEYYALGNSSEQRRGPMDCSKYVPNPCDGDDSLVDQVAGAAAKDAASLAKASVDVLKLEAKKLENLVQRKNQELSAVQNENQEAERKLTALKDAIREAYENQGLRGESRSLEQLSKIFQDLDAKNAKIIADVNEKERAIQNGLDDIARAQEELDDLNERDKQLLEDINRRNSSVLLLQEQIKTLQTKISG